MLVNNECTCPGDQTLVNEMCACPGDQILVNEMCACPGDQTLVNEKCACPGDQTLVNEKCACPPLSTLVDDACTEPCPISDSRFFIVEDKCIFLEERSMNRTDATANCAKEMANYGIGRLFEPKSLEMNNEVATKVFTLIGQYGVHIGVNDIAKPDDYVYDSDSTPISFSPKWYDIDSTSYSPGNGIAFHQCTFISMLENSYMGSWADYICSVPFYSICE